MTTQSFKSVSQVVTAVQWTGDNLAEVQAVLAPSSPLFDGRAEGAARILTVMVRDRTNEKLYPSLGRQMKGVAAKPGDWLVFVGEDDVRVVGEQDFAASYVAIAPERFLVEARSVSEAQALRPGNTDVEIWVPPPALPIGWVKPLASPAPPTVAEAPALAAFEAETLKEA